MKKFVSLLLALLMIASLAACGKKANDNNDNNDNYGYYHPTSTLLVAGHFAFGGLAGLPDVRAGRSGAALHDRPHRRGAQHAGQLAGPQVGVHLHDARHLRRCLFRLFPSVLQHQLRRCLLVVDDYPLQFRVAGRQLRIPVEGGQSAGQEHVSRLPGAERRGGACWAGRWPRSSRARPSMWTRAA